MMSRMLIAAATIIALSGCVAEPYSYPYYSPSYAYGYGSPSYAYGYGPGYTSGYVAGPTVVIGGGWRHGHWHRW